MQSPARVGSRIDVNLLRRRSSHQPLQRGNHYLLLRAAKGRLGNGDNRGEICSFRKELFKIAIARGFRGSSSLRPVTGVDGRELNKFLLEFLVPDDNLLPSAIYLMTEIDLPF